MNKFIGIGLVCVLTFIGMFFLSYRMNDVKGEIDDLLSTTYQSRYQVKVEYNSNADVLTNYYEVKIGNKMFTSEDQAFKVNVDDLNTNTPISVRAVSYIGFKTNWQTVNEAKTNMFELKSKLTNMTIENNIVTINGWSYIPALSILDSEDRKLSMQLRTLDGEKIWERYAINTDDYKLLSSGYNYTYRGFEVTFSDELIEQIANNEYTLSISYIDRFNQVLSSTTLPLANNKDEWYLVNENEVYVLSPFEDKMTVTRSSDYVVATDVYTYGESLHIEGNTFFGETVKSLDQETIYLINDSLDSYEPISYKYNTIKDQGIDYRQLPLGEYQLKVKNEDDYYPLLSEQGIAIKAFTVTRNDQNRRITIFTQNNELQLKIEEAELPEHVYDVYVDAAHGGDDTGVCNNLFCEAEESLTLSKYIKERLEAHGLKVGLTRTEEEFTRTSVTNNEYSFEEGHRIYETIKHQPKYLISNHLNKSDQDEDYKGFEIHQSHYVSGDYSQLVAQYLRTEQIPSNNDLDQLEAGIYTKLAECHEDSFIDGQWCNDLERDDNDLIRETGGIALGAHKLLTHDNHITDDELRYGVETIVVEYAYVDNEEDVQKYINSKYSWAERVVEATIENIGGITYSSNN